MVLVNGSSGIGTGYSSTVPNFNPRDIVANLRRLMAGDEPTVMHPWYKGFKGSIEVDAKKKDKYITKGIIEKVDDDRVRITYVSLLLSRDRSFRVVHRSVWLEVNALRVTVCSELPLQKWTSDYRSNVLEDHLSNLSSFLLCARYVTLIAVAGTEEGRITGFKEHHTDTTVDFLVTMAEVTMHATIPLVDFLFALLFLASRDGARSNR